MDENQNSNENRRPSGFRFNPYWIYGIIFLVMLVLTFYPRSNGHSTNWNEVRQMVLQGDVEKLLVINERMVEVYLTKEASLNDVHKN
jgi:cell division protease FtsH